MKKLLLKFFVVQFVISFSTFFSGCRNEVDEIRIGHIAPLTGDTAIWGNWETEGIQLAVDEINSGGGIQGRKIRIIQEDDKADPKTAVSALQKLISIDKIQVVIGATLSSTTLACAPIAENNKIVMLTPSAQSPKISEAGDYIFRLFVSSAIEGNYLANLAKQFNIGNVAIMYMNNDYGIGLRNILKKYLSDSKISILSEQLYNSGVKDFRSQIQKIKSVSPEAVFLLGYPSDMGTILLQMKELGFKTTVFAPDSFEADEVINIAKDAAEGVIYVYPVLPSSNLADQIKLKFRKKFNKELNLYNAMGYDAVKLLTFVIEKSLQIDGEYSGESIKNLLYTVNEFSGVTGPITFDKFGDVIERPMEVRKVTNGNFVKYNK